MSDVVSLVGDNVTPFWDYPITQGFGPTNEPLDPAANGYAHFHSGIDFGLPAGTPVGAIVGGTVVQAGQNGGYGNSVTIQDSQGYKYIYGHLSRVAVIVGDIINPQDFLGDSGSTGASTGPHLHFEVDAPGGGSVNPAQPYPGFVPGVNPGTGHQGVGIPSPVDIVGDVISGAKAAGGAIAAPITNFPSTFEGAGGAIAGAGKTVLSPITDVASAVGRIGDLFTWLFNQGMKIFFVLGGLALVAVGVFVYIKGDVPSSPPIPGV